MRELITLPESSQVSPHLVKGLDYGRLGMNRTQIRLALTELDR